MNLFLFFLYVSIECLYAVQCMVSCYCACGVSVAVVRWCSVDIGRICGGSGYAGSFRGDGRWVWLVASGCWDKMIMVRWSNRLVVVSYGGFCTRGAKNAVCLEVALSGQLGWSFCCRRWREVGRGGIRWHCWSGGLDRPARHRQINHGRRWFCWVLA